MPRSGNQVLAGTGSAGAALEAESRQRRESNQPPMTPADAAAIVAAL